MISDFSGPAKLSGDDPGAVGFAGSGDQSSGDADLPTRFRRHAAGIERAGRSPLSVSLMRGAADDIEVGGILADLVEGVPLPSGQAPALRVLGALHRLVLEGRAPQLASYYPTVGGTRTPAGVWQAAGDGSDIQRRRGEGCIAQRCADQRARTFGGALRCASLGRRALRDARSPLRDRFERRFESSRCRSSLTASPRRLWATALRRWCSKIRGSRHRSGTRYGLRSVSE